MPLRLTVAVGFVDELLVTVSLPVKAPVVAGLNCTVRVTDCFGFSVTGKVAPDTVKPVPDTVAALIVNGPVPLEARVTDCVEEESTVTLPKLKPAGLMPRVKVAAIPVPVRPTAVGELGALLTIEMLPDTAPTAVG